MLGGGRGDHILDRRDSLFGQEGTEGRELVVRHVGAVTESDFSVATLCDHRCDFLTRRQWEAVHVGFLESKLGGLPRNCDDQEDFRQQGWRFNLGDLRRTLTRLSHDVPSDRCNLPASIAAQ